MLRSHVVKRKKNINEKSFNHQALAEMCARQLEVDVSSVAFIGERKRLTHL